VNYAEPVEAKLLRKGSICPFNLRTERMCKPTVETLVFVGKDVEGKDPELLYFQDVESHQQEELGTDQRNPRARSFKSDVRARSNIFLNTSRL